MTPGARFCSAPVGAPPEETTAMRLTMTLLVRAGAAASECPTRTTSRGEWRAGCRGRLPSGRQRRIWRHAASSGERNVEMSELGGARLRWPFGDLVFRQHRPGDPLLDRSLQPQTSQVPATRRYDSHSARRVLIRTER